MIPVDLRLTFLSDWAIGSGHARHDSVDFLVRRDADGLPYVPGKTLRGIWRDTAERVALGLDAGGDGPWSRWCRYLWGDDPAAASSAPDGVLAVSSAGLPEPVRSVLLAEPDLLRAAVVTRSATALEPDTGIAKDETLRIEERARAGSVLDAVAHLDLEPPTAGNLTDAWPAFFLLLAAARSVDRVGGRRRRGAGRCTLEVVGGPLSGNWDPLLQRARTWHRDAGVIPEPPDERGVVSAPPEASAAADAPGGTRRLVVRLETLDPVLVGARVLGNAVLSHPVIPGATLLPVVAKHLGAQAKTLIRSGALVVTDATPVSPGDRERSLPAPMCLKAPKVVGDKGVTDLVNEMRATLVGADGAPRQTRAWGGFVLPGNGDTGVPTVAPRTAYLVTTVHNVIDDETQRPGLNGLYSYEALASGQEFAFEVLVPGDVAEGLLTSLVGEVRVGGSRSAEYGRARITSVEERDVTSAAARQGLTAGQPVAVWLTADIIPTGLPTVDGLLADLGAEWGTPVRVADDAERSTVFARPVRRESWQARWGLPRPSLVGLAAGSCLLVMPEAEVSAEDVARVEAAGVGERRAEGFGRILIHPEVLNQQTVRIAERAAGSGPGAGGAGGRGAPQSEVGGGREPEWLCATRRAAVETLLADAALVAARRTARLPQSLTRAQVGGLRAAADGMVDGTGFEAARTWLAGIKASKARADQWGATLGWLTGLLNVDHEVWAELGGDVHASAQALLGPLLTKGAAKELRRDAIRLVLLAAVQAHRVSVARPGTDHDGEGAA